MTRRHGWQRPLHPLQVVGVIVYSFLIVSFYTFFGLFLGNRIAEITVITIFTFTAVSVMLLFMRCSAIDPSDKSCLKREEKIYLRGVSKLNHRLIMGQIILRFFRRMERKILRTFIRRKYFDPWKIGTQIEPLLLPFPLLMKDDDAITPQLKDNDMSFCSLCNFEVKKRSKHCRSCNRCVEGFDHHCKWLNNCVGKKNYTTFILMMISVLFMLLIEGGTAMAIFVRCFADKRGIEEDLKRKLCMAFPRALLATISALLVSLSVYSLSAMGQLFFFHVVLIQKGMRTYDYIMAMKEDNKSMESDPFSGSDSSSDYSTDSDSAEDQPSFESKFICGEQFKRLSSIRIEGERQGTTIATKKEGFRAAINPWKLMKMSKEKVATAAENTREALARQKTMIGEPLKPLPSEMMVNRGSSIPALLPVISMGGFGGSSSPRRFSSPRRRFPASSAIVTASPKHRSEVDLKFSEVSNELERNIQRQVACSGLKDGGIEIISSSSSSPSIC